MQNDLLQRAGKLKKSHKQKKWWQRGVRTLAMLVVFCTTYALILPAITMEAEVVCGLESHAHTDSCYTQQQVTSYDCQLEPHSIVVHSHDALCFDGEGKLACPLAEVELHSHVEECYTAEQTLVCVLEEAESHSHSEACTTVSQLVCQLEEAEGHAHGEGCYTQQLICELPEGEEHSHEAACYTSQLTCALEEAEGHAHNGDCYLVEKVTCALPEVEGHTHSENCYVEENVLSCGKKEVTLHAHQADCYDAENNLICQLPQVVVHAHDESCVTVAEEMVQVCQLTEHEHTDACYPTVEEPEVTSKYLCGSGIHTHAETCFDEAGELICTIPEHTHEAACLVEDYDPDADVETALQWKESVANVTLSGIWSEDLLAVAKSQLGYTESTQNVILMGEELKGYTRYGAKYGKPYGEWDAMFVAFCLEYAQITEEYIPYETDAADWAEALKDAGCYADTSYVPAIGDLVFVDKDQDGEADHVGILNRITENGELEILTGNTEENMVGYATLNAGILGYGILPENPLTKEQYDAANVLAAQIAALPSVEDVEAGFRSLNDQGDKTGYEALRQELVARIDSIEKTYESLNELQKARVGTLEILDELKELCGGLIWRQHPALKDDSAVVSGLTETGIKIIPDPGRAAEEEETIPENAIRNGDWVEYTFTVDTESYFTDIRYGEAWVKLQLVLPFYEEQAAFEMSSLSWMENAHETVEVRTINDQEVHCQVITGYKHLIADEENGIVVPGSFTESVIVKLRKLNHSDKLFILLSAAMEHSTWDGQCQTHEVEEKLTIGTDPLRIYAPLSPEEQQAVYEKYLEELTALAETADLAAVSELDAQITESFLTGALDVKQYSDLNERLLILSGVDLDTIAEPSKGTGWAFMDFGVSGYTVGDGMVFSTARRSNVPMMSAMPTALADSLLAGSAQQIPENGWGGENSKDDVIWVSKTIEGTEQENVFDITLQIITKEEVTEIYKEPNMAVVIVMDISNTMVSIFSGEETVTRYAAAMDSAEAFMKKFAAETDGLSRLGYVAFNTHGHEVFPMQECSTTAQANALAKTMRNKTKSIMDKAAAATSTGQYKSSHDRFTNMEAGLKMAEDMLAGVPNEHKYVIFLSDGFPTTYMTASTSDGYKGYDPYVTSGTNGNNGVFYDRVMGHHCDYGTSYSDTAAIKARQRAVAMKKAGINIFSIGVDVEGQTIYEYHWDSALRLKTASTVERRQTASYYNSTGYEIGTLHSELTASVPKQQESASYLYPEKYLTAKQRKNMSDDFKNWLKGTATTGIGSDFYYDSVDEQDLSEAYDQIFEKILEMNAESAHLDWVATDPMPDMGVHELETMEFIGFWDMYKDNPVLTTSLSGESADNSLWNNTATFDTASSSISWDLKDSGYQSVDYGNNRNFLAALKYRVRLQNENTSFVEKQIYDTNDTTFLYYRTIEVKNGVTQISDREYIEFPIPKVFGYLSELNFLKTDPVGRPLPGAKFALTHDTANCGTCRGDGAGYVDLPVYEAVSGADGMVKFYNIPSGHHYLLTEVETPENYIKTDNIYKVVVSYDALTVTVTDADGNPLDWNETIENETYYTLPETGGVDISHLMAFGGALLVTAVTSLMYMSLCGRKQRRGGAQVKR